MKNNGITFLTIPNPIGFILWAFALTLHACQSSPTTSETSSDTTTPDLINWEVAKSNPNIEVGLLQTKSLQTQLRCTGILDIPPTDKVSVHSKLEGFLSNLYYIDGDYVKKGSLLAEIENISFIEKQRTLLELKAQLETAQKSLQRQELLANQEASSQQDLEHAQGQVNLLKASYLGLKKELELLGFQVQTLEHAATFQSVLPIFAPISGVISHVAVNKGQMVHPDDQLLELLNTAHIHVELKIFPTDTMQIAVNQKVTFNIPNSSKLYEAFVWKINPDIDVEQNTRNIHCHLKKESESSELLPGTIVQATVFSEEKSYLGLPLTAVTRSGNTYFAFLVRDNHIEKVALEAPILSSDFIAFANAANWKQDSFITKGAYYLER